MMSSALPDITWPVRRFAVWWLRGKPFNVPAHNETVHTIGQFLGVVLYRSGPFQVQLFIAPARSVVVPHAHPNVETIEMFVAGNDTSYFSSDKKQHAFGMTTLSPGEFHQAQVGDVGVCFLSMQKWLNGVQPSSIELDWIGDPMDTAHALSIGWTDTDTAGYTRDGIGGTDQ